MSDLSPLANDTTVAAQEILDTRWRQASPLEKAEIVTSLFRDCTTLTLLGIRTSYPDASPETERYQLALRRYGPELANEVYG